jgi:hypothetical protein
MKADCNLTKQEIAELLAVTEQQNVAEALRIAVRERIRFIKRTRLKELSGRIVVQDDWLKMDAAELAEAKSHATVP